MRGAGMLRSTRWSSRCSRPGCSTPTGGQGRRADRRRRPVARVRSGCSGSTSTGRDDDEIAGVVRTLGLGEVDLERLARMSDGARDRLTRTGTTASTSPSRRWRPTTPTDRLVRREIDLIAAPNVVVTVHDGTGRRPSSGSGTAWTARPGSACSTRGGPAVVARRRGHRRLLPARRADRARDRRARPARVRWTATVTTSWRRSSALRRRIGLVRRTLAPHRDALSTLGLPEIGVEDDVRSAVAGPASIGSRARWPRSRACATACSGTYDIHMGRVSQRANDVMKHADAALGRPAAGGGPGRHHGHELQGRRSSTTRRTSARARWRWA